MYVREAKHSISGLNLLEIVQSVALPDVKDRCGVKSIHKFVCHKSSFKPPLPPLYSIRVSHHV